MDKSFDKMFTRFMWCTDVIFLAASTPHIAAWYAHFDGNGDFWANPYAWVVGFGLAIAIDGVSLMLLYALTRMIKQGEKSKGVLVGILFFMGFIAALSWLINWQYDKQFASTAFQKADATTVNLWIHTFSIGTLNPIIGGAFSVLIMAYALVSKVIKEDDKPAMTEEEYQQEVARIQREKDLKALRNSDRKGILSAGKEAMFGQGEDTDTLLEKTLIYLRDATELLQPGYEQTAIQALSAHLKMKSKNVLPLFIQAKSLIKKEEQEALLAAQKDENEQQETTPMDALSPDNQQDIGHDTDGSIGTVTLDDNAMLNQLGGRDTVSIAVAAKILNCQEKYIITLRNAGKLKHIANRKDLITAASLRNYRDSHKKRNTSVPTGKAEEMPALHLVNA